MNFPHWTTDAVAVISPIVAVIWMLIQLSMKANVQETNTLVREHIARDEEKHKAIDTHLEFTDGRVNRVENAVFHSHP